jgi:thioredoxin-like negative regulator of GroEL
MRSTWKTLFALAVLATVLGAGRLPAGEPTLRWETGVAEGLKRARAEKRLVLVDFWRDQCPWCVRLETETFADERVLKALGEVVAVKVKNTENPDELARYSVDSYPTIALLDADGQAIEMHSGYLPADAFLGWLSSNRDRYARFAALKEQIRKDPRDLRAHLDLGKLYTGDGNWEEARRCFAEVIRADPEGKRRESAEALLETGITWKRSREYTRALESLQKARKIALALQAAAIEPAKGAGQPQPEKAAAGATARPGDAVEVLDRVLHETAATQLLLGKREALIQTLEEYDAKVSAPDPRRHSWVLLQLGQARKKAGALDGAKLAFQRCDELYPRSSEARQCREELAALK